MIGTVVAVDCVGTKSLGRALRYWNAGTIACWNVASVLKAEYERECTIAPSRETCAGVPVDLTRSPINRVESISQASFFCEGVKFLWGAFVWSLSCYVIAVLQALPMGPYKPEALRFAQAWVLGSGIRVRVLSIPRRCCRLPYWRPIWRENWLVLTLCLYSLNGAIDGSVSEYRWDPNLDISTVS